ncbi:MAG TPA: ATP-binding protein [Chitinophagaceae bacterium]
MNKKIFFSILVSGCLILFPALMNAQRGEGTKLLQRIRPSGDSVVSMIPKKILQQLATVSAAGGQRLIIFGASAVTKQASMLWLAKKWGKEVYRVDLSEVVSKYIGETEKNLDLIFNDQKARDNILFFDEGDELFGNRTHVSDSHDKYANQEVAYLLSRIENYQGLLALALNYNSKADSDFIRRFRYIIKAN